MKNVLVTGADHGLGFALTKQLLERGFTVYAGRLNSKETALDELAADSEGLLTVFELNIGSDESVNAAKQFIETKIESLDLLINNAGTLGDISKELGEELDFDEMLRVINVNSLGTLRMNNAFADLVLKSDFKTIVNISSEAGSIQDCERTGWFGYCMSKAANNMQSALVHNTVRTKGGRVLAFHPGHVATYMRGHLDTTGKLTPDQSAHDILKLVLDTELPVEDRPLYLDNEGNRLPW